MDDLSPLDVLGKTFSRKYRGYSSDEVQEFLAQIATTVERLLRERGEARQQVHRMEQELIAFRERETALQDALVAAQKSAESTLRDAQAEAQRIVEEGQGLADRLVDDGHRRARNIESIIGDLRTRRREVRSELRRFVEVLEGIIRDDREREREEPATPQIALLRRHQEGS